MDGVEVSPTTISNVTKAIMDEVKQCALSSPRCDVPNPVHELLRHDVIVNASVMIAVRTGSIL